MGLKIHRFLVEHQHIWGSLGSKSSEDIRELWKGKSLQIHTTKYINHADF